MVSASNGRVDGWSGVSGFVGKGWLEKTTGFIPFQSTARWHPHGPLLLMIDH